MNDQQLARIDFYVLPEPGQTVRRTFACRLAEKAYRLQHRVHIQVSDRQEAELLDELLWTFRDGSFVPHELLRAPGGSGTAPVTIGVDAPAEADLLINLTERIPEQSGTFPRVAEIVTSDEEGRKRSRRLFVDYRSRGHILETHTL
jgi:DNA polymerase III subunit chi